MASRVARFRADLTSGNWSCGVLVVQQTGGSMLPIPNIFRTDVVFLFNLVLNVVRLTHFCVCVSLFVSACL